jgi:hypothetical protein
MAQSEVAAAFLDVSADLFAQRLGAGKAHLGANPLQKRQRQGSFFVQIDRMKVQQMRFDSE